MISRLEKIIYNLYFCYLPIVIIGLLINYFLLTIVPGKCWWNSSAQECFFRNVSYDFIYHPVNIANIIVTTYNILYIYYNVILKRHVVGKAVRRIYRRLQKKYYLGSQCKQISILLFCYITASFLAYFRFAITLARVI